MYPWRRLLIVAVAAVVCAAMPLSAQHSRRPGEVFGRIGVAHYDYTSSFFAPGGRQSGLSMGGGAGVRPFLRRNNAFLPGLGFEVELSRTRTIRFSGQPDFFPETGPHTDTELTGGILYHFGLERLDLFALLGGGRRFISGWDRTDAVVHLGAGAKIFVSPRVSIRPEVRLIPEILGASTIRYSAGLGFHW